MTCGNSQDESPLAAPTPRGIATDGDAQAEKHSLTRMVSEGALSTMTESGKDSPQYVSGCEDEEGKPKLSSRDCKRTCSPMRCVSEFDEVTTTSKCAQGAPVSSNSLCCPRLRSAHVQALRLEADLQPMRMILGRLMAHPLNKKGLFNAPVDALALGLADYHQIIKKPMDLGTIKARLHSITYYSKLELAQDICLVFQNAMLYNPPGNPVHIAAHVLQDFFEELYVAVGGDMTALPVSVVRRPVAHFSASRRVSFTQEAQVPLVRLDGGTSPGNVVEGIMCTVACDVDETMVTETAASPVNLAPIELPIAGVYGFSSGSADALLPMCSPLLSTRGRGSIALATPPSEKKDDRKRRLSYSGHKKTQRQGHNCRSCLGRSCLLCEQNCLPLEPTLLVCNGANCAGAKIRKGSTYFIASDGSRQYCQRCFVSLEPVLPPTAEEETVLYKRDLLKRKNDEELVETWVTCGKCGIGVHEMCALFDSCVHPPEDYRCPGCTSSSTANSMAVKCSKRNNRAQTEMYTFITGSENPLPLSEARDSSLRLDHDIYSAEALAETEISAFIEAKVKARLKAISHVPNAEKTVTVRIVSDCDRSFKVPDVVRKHFRMSAAADGRVSAVVTPPEKVNFNSKAIALFQKMDGLDICIFCMYVQEYGGSDDVADSEIRSQSADVKKRVYIAYLDSVEHFRPRSARTTLYHELLVAYLASARMRGFEAAHIWACPPSRGNSFVFWHHPSSQRTPSRERLISWYHDVLVRALDCGVVTDVKSLYESDFRQYLKDTDNENQSSRASLDPSGKLVCPPLLEGDYWIEEAVRIHAASLARHLKAKSRNEGKDLSGVINSPAAKDEVCPARQVGSLLLDRLMAHKSAAPFRRPVNAAAMKLKDYHKIITNPMDLGTVYSRCIHGEYACLGDLVADVQLVFDNAKKFNPDGHFVHTMAVEMEDLFYNQLELVTKTWCRDEVHSHSWKALSRMSMSLDMELKIPVTDKKTALSCLEGEETTNGTVREEGAQEKVGDGVLQSCRIGLPCELPGSAKPVELKMKTTSVDDLLAGGADVLANRMAGEDRCMIEKKNNLPQKKSSVSQKDNANGKRRRSSSSINPSTEDDPSSKRRRQTWLGEEVGASVRSMRTSIFACSLVPASPLSQTEQEKVTAFSDYTRSYQPSQGFSSSKFIGSQIADARASLLEFSQRRNLEFDTLRHAKYSTSVLLYHLHNPEAPGVIPTCTACKQETINCRWHKVVKIEELCKVSTKRRKIIKNPAGSERAYDQSKVQPEELCTDCHSKHPQQDHFIPLQVSFL